MPLELRVNLAHGPSVANDANWVHQNVNADTLDVVDFNTGLATGVDIILGTIFQSAVTSVGAGGSACSGDAAWAGSTANLGGWVLTASWSDVEYQNLDPAKKYCVEFYGLSSSGGPKPIDTRVNGGAVVTLPDVVQNFTDVAQHLDISPDVSGTIKVEFQDGGGSGVISAMRLYEVAGPTVTLNQTELTPGGTISGTYSNFSSTPTSPLTLTDSNGNTISVPVTVDSGAKTWTGTMPALPTSGSIAGLLFGNIDVELS